MDHKILCNKFATYGVQHRELSWLKFYLANRKQYCRVNGIKSETEDFEVGVPQGSCLSPLVFLIYINDLPLALQDCNVPVYADDTSLCYRSNDMTQLNGAINNNLKKLDSRLQDNKLALNVAKTQSMFLATKQKRRILENQHKVLDLNINGNELQIVQNTNYLRVQIESSLDWKEQIKALFVKVSRALGFLKHAKNLLLPRETLRTLYTGIVEPHFRYWCSVWGCAGSTKVKKLQKL